MRESLYNLCVITTGALLAFGCSEPTSAPPLEAAKANAVEHTYPANALAGESSPYLLLHAHNPVNWLPWGPDAFRKAREEDKPIFLSVGYSTCFWCHVMERLVFSDPEIADLMNRWFVSIKVDREERPDVDALYMTATQLSTGQGGWPNSVFLTPELKPFYAGTYFPPEDDPRLGRPGFPTVLRALHDVWETRRDDAEQRAERLTAGIRAIQASPAGNTVSPTRAMVDKALYRLRLRYDPNEGGFGGAPKFPPDMAFELIWAAHESEADSSRLEMMLQTLRKMALGGIHDHIGGGFHRYSTDARWHVPHFEKMLYNQGQLARAYVKAYEVTGDLLFRNTAEAIFGFVKAEMTSPEGAFYSALDAQTDGEEGVYYVWTEPQIRTTLGADAEAFLEDFGLAPLPEGEGGALYRKTAPLDGRHAEALKTLGTAREKRERPFLDDKIIAGWNGLMIDAYAEGYRVLGRHEYLEAAEKAADFILSQMSTPDADLLRTWRLGQARIDGYQRDYVFFVRGLMGLFRATRERRYLDLAIHYTNAMVDRFRDAEGGYYLAPPSDHLIVRLKVPHESAIPSGNSQAVHNFLDLAEYVDEQLYLEPARQTLEAFAPHLEQSPGNLNHMAAGLLRYLDRAGDPVAEAPRTAEPKGSLALPLESDPVSLHVPNSVAAVSGETLSLNVVVEVMEGWHVNANPSSDDMLIPTRLSLASDLEVKVRSVVYPEPERVDFAFTDMPLNVYQGSVPIRAELLVTSGLRQEGVLHLLLEYQACDDTRCLAPASLEETITISVTP